MAGGLENGLVVLRQVGICLDVDEKIELGTPFPPAGVVVVLGDLVETELLVVVRAHPLRRVDRALFQRRIDIAAGDLLRHDAELLQRQAAGASDPHLEALEVGDRLDLLAKPAAHLRAGVAGREAHDVVFLEEVVVELAAPAVVHPRVLLSAIHAKRNRAAERERRVLAEEVIGRRVAALHRRVLHGVDDAERRHDLATREYLDLELVVGSRRDGLAQHHRPAKDGVEALGEARRQPPLHFEIDIRSLGRYSTPGTPRMNLCT